MLIHWGREYIQFYNDGFLPILGASKHPGALGQPTAIANTRGSEQERKRADQLKEVNQELRPFATDLCQFAKGFKGQQILDFLKQFKRHE